MRDDASLPDSFERPRSFYARHGKRLIDVAVVGAAIVALAPIIAGITAVVRVCLGSPVLFRQRRTGRDGVPFEILKFRSMTEARSEDGSLLADGERLTSLGRFLRATSLDELPELWNVLRGDMSVVGPRPLLHKYMSRYTPRQHYRHDVRPGITGWAAVNGRNTTTWEERFELDLYYVENVSLALDLEILARTLVTVLSRRDINPREADTMSEYEGIGRD
ncbi:MAG: sugar transferase [Gemmatimonadota bacterium]